MAAKKRRTPGSGATRQLPSGRWQARFTGADGVMRPAPMTFDTKLDASAWLGRQLADVERGTWAPPKQRERGVLTFGTYAGMWMEARELRPSTRQHYETLLQNHILPALADARLDQITAPTIRNWYGTLDPNTPTARSHGYALVRAIFTTAVADDVYPHANPCRIRGAGSAKKVHKTRIASLEELDIIVDHMPERWRLLVLLAAWCGLRFGELAALERGDIDVEAGTLSVDRGMTRAKGEVYVGDPKTDAGKRVVAIPPHLLPAVQNHLAMVKRRPNSLLFPAVRGPGYLHLTTLRNPFMAAREAAGRPDLRFHDLRHTGATLAAATGATLADLMHRMGHNNPAAALRYQHAAADRDQHIADALSEFADKKVVGLRSVGRSA